MRRREFVIGGLTAAALPSVAVSQSVRQLGVLMGVANDAQGQGWAAALVQGLSAFNWREGANVRIDWRWAGGDHSLIERHAAELATLDYDVIVVESSPAVAALRQQKSNISMVFVNVADPVGQGFVESLPHPGGTITGFSGFDAPMGGKWLQMLTQINPPVTNVGALFNPATAPYAGLMLNAIEGAAPSSGVTVRTARVGDNDAVKAVLEELAREERSGLVVLPSAFTVVHLDLIVALAAQYRLPAVYAFRSFVEAGGLMSYGTDQLDLFLRSASYVDRIFRGAMPADLPVQAPTKYLLSINLKTAKALGLTIPQTLVATADEVIE